MMLVKGFLARLNTVRKLKNYDVVYVLEAGFPYGPPLIERLIGRQNVPLVFDFDDAIQIHKPSGNHRLLDFLKPSSRTAEVVALASQVVVPNNFLAEFARNYNSRVTIIPEAEDTTRLIPRGPHSNQQKTLVIGWVGSPSTAKYLNLISEALKEICSSFPSVVVRVIGGHYEADGVRIEHVQWNFDQEAEQFHGLDIGIMPLPMEDWSKGKSGCKLRQYMATGVPGVGTRIGYNCELVRDGETGFLVETQQEWIDALSRLIEDPHLRNQIATAARKDVEQRFAVEVIGPQVRAAFQEVTSSTDHKSKC